MTQTQQTNTLDGSSASRFAVGPGLLVTAAFIGPGTVITASRAGTLHGCDLLWVVVFASLGTIVLQQLAARLGILTGLGLSEAIRREFERSVWLKPALALIITAIGLGNAAYQTGNLTGAVVGLTTLFGGSPEIWVLAISVSICLVLGFGKDKLLQQILVLLVVFLSGAFLITALTNLPSWDRIFRGATIPSLNASQLSIIVALIGTTIVPYNLFLHASRSAQTWRGVPSKVALSHSRTDTIVAIALGGLVTASILLTACTAFYDNGIRWESPSEIASQLRPILGPFSGTAFALGMFAAGLTSAITAPLATSYAVCGCLGYSTQTNSGPFRGIAIGVVAIGALFASLFGKSPVSIIITAQISNGLLLPVVATIMLVVIHRQARKQDCPTSSTWTSLAWVVVVLIGLLGLWRAWTGVLQVFQ